LSSVSLFRFGVGAAGGGGGGRGGRPPPPPPRAPNTNESRDFWGSVR
jgi:hypothetical protein